MGPFEAYSTFTAVYRHFTTAYDFHRYSGKVRLRRDSFEKRKDRHLFERLSDRRNVLDLCVTRFSTHPSSWVTDVLTRENNTATLRRVGTIESLGERTRELLSQEGFDLERAVTVVSGRPPPLLWALRRGQVEREVAIALDRVVGFKRHWDAEVEDYLWSEQQSPAWKKYSPFVRVDTDRILRIICESTF